MTTDPQFEEIVEYATHAPEMHLMPAGRKLVLMRLHGIGTAEHEGDITVAELVAANVHGFRSNRAYLEALPYFESASAARAYAEETFGHEACVGVDPPILIRRATTNRVCICLDCTGHGPTVMEAAPTVRRIANIWRNGRVVGQREADLPKWVVCHECGVPHGFHGWDGTNESPTDRFPPSAEELIANRTCYTCHHWLREISKYGGPKHFVTGQYSVISARRTGELSKHDNPSHMGFGGNRHELERLDTGVVTISCDMWHAGDVPERFRDRLVPNCFSWRQPRVATNRFGDYVLRIGDIVRLRTGSFRLKVVGFNRDVPAISKLEFGAPMFKVPSVVCRRAGREMIIHPSVLCLDDKIDDVRTEYRVHCRRERKDQWQWK